MTSSGISLLYAMICSFLLPAVTYLLFGGFSVGLAFSVFNLFSYGFGVWDLVFVSFFCHWVINEILFRSAFCAGLTNSGFACISFVLFLKSDSRGCTFLSPLSQHILHLISSPFHFSQFFSPSRLARKGATKPDIQVV